MHRIESVKVPAPEENGTPSYSSLRMWAQRADAWAYSADLPQHVKSVAILARAHCPKDQALASLGNSGEPEKNNLLCRARGTTVWGSEWSWPNAEEEEVALVSAPCYVDVTTALKMCNLHVKSTAWSVAQRNVCRGVSSPWATLSAQSPTWHATDGWSCRHIAMGVGVYMGLRNSIFEGTRSNFFIMILAHPPTI
jgi:hypothetical protein